MLAFEPAPVELDKPEMPVPDVEPLEVFPPEADVFLLFSKSILDENAIKFLGDTATIGPRFGNNFILNI